MPKTGSKGKGGRVIVGAALVAAVGAGVVVANQNNDDDARKVRVVGSGCMDRAFGTKSSDGSIEFRVTVDKKEVIHKEITHPTFSPEVQAKPESNWCVVEEFDIPAKKGQTIMLWGRPMRDHTQAYVYFGRHSSLPYNPSDGAHFGHGSKNTTQWATIWEVVS